MPSAVPPVLGDDPASLDALWEALESGDGVRRPYIRAVMITSVDGASTVDGRSAGLGTRTDQLLFHAMRARADLVLVGASTALAEGYGPAEIRPEWTARRSGPPPVVLLLARRPRPEVVDHCADAGVGVQLAVGPDSDPRDVAAARDRGVVVHELGTGPLGDEVRALVDRLGAAEVDFEGGPRLLATLLDEGAVDELVLTISPRLVLGGDSSRLVEGDAGPARQHPMRVVAAFSCPEGGLYTRWAVDHGAG